MPHFENLDQYEARNPKSGKREIIPIAPHSLQATDYRPRKGDSEPAPRKKRHNEFKTMQIEPISVQQMEKEFRAAGKQMKRSRNRGKSLWKKIVKLFKSLFGPKKKANQKRQHDRKRGQQPGRSKSRGQRNPNRTTEQQSRGKPEKHRPNKSNRQNQQNRKNKNQQPDRSKSGNDQHSKGTNADRDNAGQSNQPNARNKRNRRNRGRGNRPGKPGNAQSSNQ